MKKHLKHFTALVLLLTACHQDDTTADAVGSFEATETIVSAEANGKVMAFSVKEGESVKAGQTVGYIDSIQLHLNKLQLLQNRKAILSGRPDIPTQVDALKHELEVALADKKRIEVLVKGEVASAKQLEDATSRVRVIQSKIAAQQSMLSSTSSTLTEQARTVNIQLAQTEDMLKKCRIVNPVEGTVLATYTNPFEITTIGKPLYRIADLTQVELKAFITNDQYTQLKLGQAVKISVDAEGGGLKEYTGIISWISSKAEFTPKTIQTKDERANLVYAIKVSVKNDGLIKIGMYGEVSFH